MTTAIRKHMSDFIALTLLFAVALAAAGYMLAHQRLRFPIIQDKPMTLKADFSDAHCLKTAFDEVTSRRRSWSLVDSSSTSAA